VRVRFADTRPGSDITVLLAPWPESLWAFRRIWSRVSAVGRVVAIDLPGFGHSDGRSELIAPDTSGTFLARLIDEWGLGAPYVVGPDVGTAAALLHRPVGHRQRLLQAAKAQPRRHRDRQDPRPRALLDHRPRLARSCRHRPGLYPEARPALTPPATHAQHCRFRAAQF